jgi:hypothetical protein
MFGEEEELNKIKTEVEANGDVNKIIENMKGVKEVDVVITGGFHSQTVTDILKNHGVSYIVITPNVTDGVKLAEETYYQIAKEQSKISFQTLANLIASLSPATQQKIFEILNNGKTDEDFLGLDQETRTEKLRETIYANLLESDDTGDIKTKMLEVIKNTVSEELREYVTPERIDEIKTENLKNILENKDKLEKVIRILSEDSKFKQVSIVLTDLVSIINDFSVTYQTIRVATKGVEPSEKEKQEKEILKKKIKGYPKFKTLTPAFRDSLKKEDEGRYASVIDRLEEIENQIEEQGLESLSNDTLREYADLQNKLWHVIQDTKERLEERVKKLARMIEENTEIVFAPVGNSAAAKGSNYMEHQHP